MAAKNDHHGMDYSAIESCIKWLKTHERIMRDWANITPNADRLLGKMVDTPLRLISAEVVNTFVADMNAEYDKYFREHGIVRDAVIKAYLERARTCKRCRCSGRFWPGAKEQEREEDYGYEVEIYDNYGYKNLLDQWQEDNHRVLESELDKLKMSDVEKFCLSHAGYRVHIAKNKSRYYRTDY
jgi:hypothetical protein